MYSLKRRINLHIALLLTVGFAVFVVKFAIVRPIDYVGHADAAAYAEMADSLLKGRGFEVDYVSWYFIKYPKIVRPEDHWPPLYSIAIAPFFLTLGKSAFAAKLPSLIISCFFLPLVIYSLARELSGSKFAGLAAGFSVLLYPALFRSSLYCLSDVIFTFVVCAFVLFSAKALEKGKSFYAAGVFMGLAYYAKGSGILLIPCHVVFHVIARRSFKKVFTDRKFLISLLISFLILLPWLIRNYAHFGDPLFSTQRFAAGYGGYKGWEEGTYELYWGEKPPPTYFDKFKDGVGYVADMTKKYLQRYVWWVFMDIKSNWGKFSNEAFLTYFTNIPAVLGLFILWGNRKRFLIWIVSAALVIFLSLCWFPIDRMAFPVIPLMMAMGWATYFVALRAIFRLLAKVPLGKLIADISSRISLGAGNLERKRREFALILGRYVSFAGRKLSLNLVTGLALCCLAAPVVILSSESIGNAIEKSGYPYREGSQDWMDMGKWLRENAPPDSITMTRNPWELHFYSDQLGIQIPLASLEKTIEVMRYYKPTHIIPQLDIRPSLKPLVSGEVPGLELVYGNKSLKLYKINYDLLPEADK